MRFETKGDAVAVWLYFNDGHPYIVRAITRRRAVELIGSEPAGLRRIKSLWALKEGYVNSLQSGA